MGSAEFKAGPAPFKSDASEMVADQLAEQIGDFNPAWAVRGPKHVIKKGETPVLTAEEDRQFLESIATDSMVGLRDIYSPPVAIPCSPGPIRSPGRVMCS